MSSCANGPLEKWGSQTMAWAEDDMAIVAEMAAEAGIALPQAGVNREICRALKPRRLSGIVRALILRRPAYISLTAQRSQGKLRRRCSVTPIIVPHEGTSGAERENGMKNVGRALTKIYQSEGETQ